MGLCTSKHGSKEKPLDLRNCEGLTDDIQSSPGAASEESDEEEEEVHLICPSSEFWLEVPLRRGTGATLQQRVATRLGEGRCSLLISVDARVCGVTKHVSGIAPGAADRLELWFSEALLATDQSLWGQGIREVSHCLTASAALFD